MSTREVVSDVHALVEDATLLRIEVIKLAAERRLDVENDDSFTVEPSYTLAIDLRDNRDGFRVRLSTDLMLPLGGVSCVAYAEYEMKRMSVGAASTEAMGDFINGVVLMHVIPYVRQSISDLTMRVFNFPLLMPMIQRGDIGFELTLEPDSALLQEVNTTQPE